MRNRERYKANFCRIRRLSCAEVARGRLRDFGTQNLASGVVEDWYMVAESRKPQHCYMQRNRSGKCETEMLKARFFVRHAKYSRELGACARGFSLIELMITVAVLGVLLAIATPNFIEMINSTRVSSQADELASNLALARSEAVTRGLRVVICISTDGQVCVSTVTPWESGRLTFVDNNADGVRTVDLADPTNSATNERLLRYEQPLRGNTSITQSGFSNATRIAYGPYGGLVPVTAGSFRLCSAGATNGRLVSVAATGRVTTTRTACP